jgi:hypothetical protein
MQGRNILDGVVLLHEAVHELHTKKPNGVFLKLDFEKSYEKFKWSFLQQTLIIKGFSNEWRALINNFMSRVVWPLRSIMTLAATSELRKFLDRAAHYHLCYLT